MELKSYLQVLLRRWPAVLILPLLVGLFAIYEDATRTTHYAATARLAVVRQPDPQPVQDFRYDEYYNYLTSEFKIDDLTETVSGNVFATAVAERMSAEGVTIGADEVQSALSNSRHHRILSVTASTPDPDRSMEIALGAAAELEGNAKQYLDLAQDDASATVRAIQLPKSSAPDTQEARLILILGVIVALAAGFVLAFLVDYLDDTLYDGDSAAAATDLPLLANVPAGRSG